MTKFNQNQEKAIKANEPEIIILAPAGSGKTTTLIGAIDEYKSLYPDDRVVAITFTRKAAEDLTNKLIEYSNIRASTIHSWAYTELDNLSKKVRELYPDNTFKVKLLEEDKIKEILTKLARDRNFKYIKIYFLYSYVMGNYNIDVSQSMKRIFESVKNDYIEYKKLYNLYDFTDLPQYLLDKLNDYEMNIDGIDALFVDEFQDVDDIQLELFNRTPTRKKFYIGDVQQSIYIFRGATPDVLGQLSNFSQHHLTINYRSFQEIIDFASTVRNRAIYEGINFTVAQESLSSDIICIKGYGGEVYSMNASGAAYKINEYVKRSGIEVVKEFMNRDSMILCRTNREVKAIKNIGYLNVSTIHQAKGLEYESVIVTGFPLDPAELEEINIAYVAMTRAEDYLLVADFNILFDYIEKIIPTYNKYKSLF